MTLPPSRDKLSYNLRRKCPHVRKIVRIRWRVKVPAPERK